MVKKVYVSDEIYIKNSDIQLKDLATKNIMTIALNKDSNVTASTWTKLTNVRLHNSIGNKLKFSNNSIAIGDGVSKVLVSGTCRAIKETTNKKICQFSIGRTVSESVQLINSASTDVNISISPILFDVKKNDEFKMQIANNGDFQVAGATNGLLTYMTVEVVE